MSESARPSPLEVITRNINQVIIARSQAREVEKKWREEFLTWTDGTRSTPLTNEQRNARKVILNALTEKSKNIVLISGIPGIGKTVVVEGFADDIRSRGGIVDHDAFLAKDYRSNYKENVKVVLSHRGPIIVPATPSEAQTINEKYQTKHKILEHRMKGMTREETEALFNKLLVGKTPKIPIKDLIAYSMGIPRLVLMLANDPYLTTSTANLICANYLSQFPGVSRDIQGSIDKNVYVVPPEAVVTKYQSGEIDDETQLERMGLYFENRYDIQQREGIIEELPEFIDPQTQKIYLEASKMPKGELLWIIAPNVSSQDYARLTQALGYPRDVTGRVVSVSCSEQRETKRGTRWKMFNLDGPKGGIWYRAPDGTEVSITGEGYLKSEKNEMMDRCAKIPYFAKDSSVATNGVVFLPLRDHLNFANTTLLAGWMMETLLQQRGIAYYVENYIAEKKYYFNPAENKIVELGAL